MIQHDIISRAPRNASPVSPTNSRFASPSGGDSATRQEEANARMEGLSLEQLHVVIKQGDNNFTQLIIDRAAAIRAIEKKQGKPMTGLSHLPLFRRIARGETAPELAVLFLTKSRNITDPLYHLPIRDQIQLAAKPVVPVYEPGVGGKMDTRMVDLTQASVAVINQVISPEGIRSPEEQKAHLAITAPVTLAAKFEKARAQATAKCVSEPKTHHIKIHLTATQHGNAVKNAKARGVSLEVYLFQAADLGGAFKVIKG